jgi:hypothetical protein
MQNIFVGIETNIWMLWTLTLLNFLNMLYHEFWPQYFELIFLTKWILNLVKQCSLKVELINHSRWQLVFNLTPKTLTNYLWLTGYDAWEMNRAWQRQFPDWDGGFETMHCATSKTNNENIPGYPLRTPAWISCPRYGMRSNKVLTRIKSIANIN